MSTHCLNGFSHAEHLALLKQAIAANLAARIEHDLRQETEAEGQPSELKVICAADLMMTDPDKVHLESIIGNPVRRALRVQLKDLGWHLFRLLGSTKGMLAVAEEIAVLKPGRSGVRINIIDKAWDGIGEGGNRWVA
jgi:hypothetical protein